MPARPPVPAGFLAVLATALLAACSSLPPDGPGVPPGAASGRGDGSYFSLDDPLHSQEMVIFALGLLDTGYRFGGRNPEAGLDCSGMVSYIVEQISGRRLPHNAAQIAQLTRPISVSALQAGDLVFFNTRNQRHSHMGIYLGDGRFVHAPSSRGRVRVELLDNPYFRSRIDGARRLVAAN
ncbi:C40 family peptidase [Azoarcus sp. PA01]|nr:C40 family peptidase [Azoarcus sp. PA01]